MNFDRRAVAAPTREIANWIAALRYEDLPPRTREVVHIAILDTVGAGVYGYQTPWAQKLLAWARRGGSASDATVWGDAGPSLRAADAALVNGTAAHAFELDDYHNAKLHPGAVVVSAALAVAEQLNSSGTQLVTAIAAGYEVMIRTSLALNPSATRLRGWHLTGVCGPFGAAAACASLMKLDNEQCAWALGLAGTQGAGLWAFNADGTMSKRLHAGKAAHSGVHGGRTRATGLQRSDADLRIQRRRRPESVFRRFGPAPLTQDLGSVYHLDKTSIKPYSCCGSTHSYIDAALALRKKFGSALTAQTPVRVGTSKVVDVQCGFDYAPSSALNAQMSLRYVVAAALLDGQVLPAQFADARMTDPALGAFANKLELVPDPELDKLYPKDFAGWVAASARRQVGARRHPESDGLGPLADRRPRHHGKIPRHQSATARRPDRGRRARYRASHRTRTAGVAAYADVEPHSTRADSFRRDASPRAIPASTMHHVTVDASPSPAAMRVAQSKGDAYPTKPIRHDRAVRAWRRHGHRGARYGAEADRVARPVRFVDNRAGGGGTIGAETAVRSAPDGYTLAMVPAAMRRTRRFQAAYDPVNDVTPIALIGETGFLVSLHPSVRPKTSRN